MNISINGNTEFVFDDGRDFLVLIEKYMGHEFKSYVEGIVEEYIDYIDDLEEEIKTLRGNPDEYDTGIV